LKRPPQCVIAGIAIGFAVQISRFKCQRAPHVDMVVCTCQEGVLILIGQQVLKCMAGHQHTLKASGQAEGATIRLNPGDGKLPGQGPCTLQHGRHNIHAGHMQALLGNGTR
jgi:hypothetical protein